METTTNHEGASTTYQEGASDQMRETDTKTNGLFLNYLRADGMWMTVGQIVSVSGVELPFIISKIFLVPDGTVFVKLINVHDGRLREDFVVSCNIDYVTLFSGGKVVSNGNKAKVEQEAFQEFCDMSERVSHNTKLQMRKMALGHVMRVGLKGGFSNLSCVRLNLGPSDILLDNKIFNFSSLTATQKFSLIGNDYQLLDSIMGKEWDVKLGRGEDSFFKFITEVQIKRSSDLSLSLVAKFSQSHIVFCSSYRAECSKAIAQSREGIEALALRENDDYDKIC